MYLQEGQPYIILEVMTKTIISFSLLFVFSWQPLTVTAQQIVTGQITDRHDDTPIPGASVFIAHTTIGTLTDIDGNFSLTVPIQGSFIIVVSHIGFQSASRTVDTPQPYHHINFRLQENILQELVVTPGLPHRRRDENLFWRFFLGERPSSRGMQVLNPEVVQFSRLPSGILRAFADKPIEIVNHHMGYRITYVLQRFEHDFENETSLILGASFFTELTPQNERQRNNWERRRQLAYSGSLTRFIRALYQEQLYESGFLLTKEDPMEQNRLIPLSLTQADSIRMRVPFDANRRAEETFSYNHILQRDMGAVQANIEQPLLLGLISTPITYDMFREPDRILFGRHETFPLIRLFPSSFIIYSDGSYSGVLDLSEYRNSVIGLRRRLPIEFGLSANVEQAEIYSPPAAQDSFPLEILYVHTDKQNYFTGENIWFRAYLVNPHTFVQDTLSRYVYAELINSQREIVNRVKIRHDENGVFAGHIPVTEELEAGSYILRFYTRHLESFGEEHFFQRVIQIITPQSLEASNLTEHLAIENGRLPEQRTDMPVSNDSFSVSFHPEGGDIPVGVSTRVAFKALNSSGLGENIQGVIVNERGDIITHIESAHLGMGSFMLTAESNERFSAIVQNAAGTEKQFDLPLAREDAVSLQVSFQDENVAIHLPYFDDSIFYLTLQYRGVVIQLSQVF